jgi:hypothetical protein
VTGLTAGELKWTVPGAAGGVTKARARYGAGRRHRAGRSMPDPGGAENSHPIRPPKSSPMLPTEAASDGPPRLYLSSRSPGKQGSILAMATAWATAAMAAWSLSSRADTDLAASPDLTDIPTGCR